MSVVVVVVVDVVAAAVRIMRSMTHQVWLSVLELILWAVEWAIGSVTSYAHYQY